MICLHLYVCFTQEHCTKQREIMLLVAKKMSYNNGDTCWKEQPTHLPYKSILTIRIQRCCKHHISHTLANQMCTILFYFDFYVFYIAGSQNKFSDTLSCKPEYQVPQSRLAPPALILQASNFKAYGKTDRCKRLRAERWADDLFDQIKVLQQQDVYATAWMDKLKTDQQAIVSLLAKVGKSYCTMDVYVPFLLREEEEQLCLDS